MALVATSGRRPSLGLTLIELLVVVALLGIIASLAAPSFTDYIGRKRVEGFASELASDLQYARSEAVSRNTAVRVVFTSATAYTIQVETPLPSALTCTASGTVATIKTQTLTNGVTLTGSGGGALPTCFAFEPVRGSAPANGIVEATLGSARLRLGVGSSGRVQTCLPSGSVLSGYGAC